jgi:hypothetical protein
LAVSGVVQNGHLAWLYEPLRAAAPTMPPARPAAVAFTAEHPQPVGDGPVSVHEFASEWRVVESYSLAMARRWDVVCSDGARGTWITYGGTSSDAADAIRSHVEAKFGGDSVFTFSPAM